MTEKELLVLNYVRNNPGQCSSDIMRALGFQRRTFYSVKTRLQRSNLVKEVPSFVDARKYKLYPL